MADQQYQRLSGGGAPMIWKVLTVFLCLLASSAAATTTVVQCANGSLPNNSTTSASGTAVFGSNVTSGNAVIVGFLLKDVDAGSWTGSESVSDTRSTSYSSEASFTSFTNSSRRFGNFIYAGTLGSSGANTVTVSLTGLDSSKGGAIFVCEVNQLTSLTPTATNTGSSASNNTITTGNVSWTGTDFLFSVILGNCTGATTWTAGNSNFTVTKNEAGNTSFASLEAVGAAASFASPQTFSTSSSPGCGTGTTGITELAAAFPGIAAASNIFVVRPPP